MSWFDATSFSKYAKSALKNAQKNIDKVLDIKDEDDVVTTGKEKQASKKTSYKPSLKAKNDDSSIQTDSFFDSFLGNENPKKPSSRTRKTDNEKAINLSKDSEPLNTVKTPKKQTSTKSSSSYNIQKLDSNETSLTSEKVLKSDFFDEPLNDDTLKLNNTDISVLDTINKEGLINDNLEVNFKPVKSDVESFSPQPVLQSDCFLEAATHSEDFDSPDYACSLLKDESFQNDTNSSNESILKEGIHETVSLFVDPPIEALNNTHIDPQTHSEISNSDNCLTKKSTENGFVPLGEDYVENIINNKNTEEIDKIDFRDSGPEKVHDNNPTDIETNISEDVLIEDVDVNDSNENNPVVAYSRSQPFHDSVDTDFYDAENDDKIPVNGENLSAKLENEATKIENETLEISATTQAESQILEISPIVERDKQSREISSTTNTEIKNLAEKDKTAIHTDVGTFSDEASTKIANLEKKVEEMHKILDAREKKLFELSKENIELNEASSIYRNQLDQLEKVKENESKDAECMQKEFSLRVGEFERKLKEAFRERDSYKQRFEELQDTMDTSVQEKIKSLSETIIERDETISNLMLEGDSLSRKELEANNRIKKLRIKLKEVNNENKTAQEKITKLNTEIDTLQSKIFEKTESEAKLNSEVLRLEKLTDLQEDEITVLKDKIDDMEEKYKPIESSLESCYGEINKLNLEKAQVDSLLQEKQSLLDTNEVLNNKLKELEKARKYGNEELSSQLENLQEAFTRSVQQATRREDSLKTEINDLQLRVEEGEKRNQELSQSVTTATRPLLRQIENLQSSHTTQARNWERIEKNLTDRLADMQHQYDLAVEKEHSATQYANEMKSKFKVLEKQLRELKDNKNKLEMSLENERTKNADATDSLTKEKGLLEKRLEKMKDLYESLNVEKSFLEEQMAAEKIRYENDISRLNSSIMVQQQMNLQRANSVSSIEPPSTPTSRHSPRFSTPDISYSISDSMSIDGRLTATTVSMELLETQLRKRDGEVYVLKEEVKSLEKTKASLARELVTLTNENEELETSKEELTHLKEKHTELQSRYNAVLQMYGEKEEEAEELKMDLSDVKQMYKQQIEQLLGGR